MFHLQKDWGSLATSDFDALFFLWVEGLDSSYILSPRSNIPKYQTQSLYPPIPDGLLVAYESKNTDFE
jgi:hypothetical protein